MSCLHTFACSLVIVAVVSLPQPGFADSLNELPLPGSVKTIARIAGVDPALEPGQALAVIARALHQAPPDTNVDIDRRLEQLVSTFATLSAFEEALGRVQPAGGGVSLSLANDREARRHLTALLEQIDLTLRDRSGRLIVERRNNRVAALRAHTLAEFGIDSANLAERLNAGETVHLALTREQIAVPLSAETWSRLVFDRPVSPEWLVPEILSNRRAALLAYGLMSVDDVTADYLATHPAILTRLSENHAGVFAGFASSLRIHDGRVIPPGGPETAELWEWVLDAPADNPEAFIRALYTSRDKRLAYVYDLIAHLDGPHQAFAMGSWIDDVRVRREAFRALIDASLALTSAWNPDEYPFGRPAYDAALLLSTARVGANGAPLPPSSRKFWRVAFSAEDLPEKPDRDLRDAEEDGSLDAAFLVANATFEDPNDRARRLQQFTFGQRVFAQVDSAGLPDALVAVAGYPAYTTLFQALERAGVRQPATYAASAKRARALSALSGARAAIALSQFQGAVALVARLSRAGAIASDATERLASSLAALDHPDGRYGGVLAAWIDTQVAPALGAPVDRSLLLDAAAGLTSPDERTTRAMWERQPYDVSFPRSERARLERSLASQNGRSIDEVLALTRALAELATPDITVDAVTRVSSRLPALAEPLIAAPAYTTVRAGNDPAKPARQAVERIARDLSRLTRPNDLKRIPRVIDPLLDLVDETMADALRSLTYAFALDERGEALLGGGSAAARHDFGLAESGWFQTYRRWMEPTVSNFAGGTPYVTGSLLGLDLAVSRQWLTRAPGKTARLPLLDTQEAILLVRTLALVDPYALDNGTMTAIATAIAAGRARVTAAVEGGDQAGFDQLAGEVRMDALRHRSARWDLSRDAARAAAAFSATELFQLGGGVDVERRAAWGTMSLEGCWCTALAGPSLAPALTGRAEIRLLPIVVPDLQLRVAESLHELELPAALTRDVLALAMTELLDTYAARDTYDWQTLSRAAQSLTRERVQGYVAAIVRTSDLLRQPLAQQ